VDGGRPGIADADRPRPGPFATLLAQIPGDPEALDAIAFAYQGLDVPERRRLIRAALQDAADPSIALGALLAVETEPALAAELIRLLQRHRAFEATATLEECSDGGEAHLVRRFLGFASEELRVVWKGSAIKEISIESRVEINSRKAVPVEEVVDTVSPMLWRYLRAGGNRPHGIERFAGFFSVVA
jgi:hypothetical protein